jgi:hypothetical protein
MIKTVGQLYEELKSKLFNPEKYREMSENERWFSLETFYEIRNKYIANPEKEIPEHIKKDYEKYKGRLIGA